MPARRKKTKLLAAGMINSTQGSQTQEVKQSSENTGINVGKNSPRVMPLSHRKHTSVAVKRKADSNCGKTVQSKQTPDLSKESVQTDLYVGSDTKLADEKTQNHQSKIQNKTETSDVQTNSHVLHDFILSHSISQVIKLLEVVHPFSQDDLDKSLILACQKGYKYIALKLIDSGANVNCIDPDGNTPLMICSKNGFIDLVQLLLTKNPILNSVNSAGDTALILCIRSSGSTEIAKLFLRSRRVYIDHHNKEGYTALMKAVEAFDIGTAYILLEHSFEMFSKLRDDPWWNLHSFAFGNCKNETTGDIFEKHGLGLLLKMFKACIQCNKKLSGPGKPSPLDLAVQACDVDTLNLFLNSVDLDEGIKKTMISDAYTNLFEQKFKGMNIFTECHISVVKRLLELGASLVGTAQNSPMCIATEAGSYALVELLCQHGANRNHPYWVSGPHPLSIAARMGRSDLIELMLTFGVNVSPSSLSSALDNACCHGHTDCAKLLMQQSTKVET